MENEGNEYLNNFIKIQSEPLHFQQAEQNVHC